MMVDEAARERISHCREPAWAVTPFPFSRAAITSPSYRTMFAVASTPCRAATQKRSVPRVARVRCAFRPDSSRSCPSGLQLDALYSETCYVVSSPPAFDAKRWSLCVNLLIRGILT